MIQSLPPNYPTFDVYLDESGVGASDVFVLGAMSISPGDDLITRVHDFRRKSAITTEFKFAEIRRTNASYYREVVRMIAGSSAHFRGFVVDRSSKKTDIFRHHRSYWQAQSQLAIRAIRWVTPNNALAAVMMDQIGVPEGTNYDNYVRVAVNKNADRLVAVSAVSLDSKTSLGLQLVDLACGAIAYQYRRDRGTTTGGSSKSGVADALAEALNIGSLVDVNTRRFAVDTWTPGPKK